MSRPKISGNSLAGRPGGLDRWRPLLFLLLAGFLLSACSPRIYGVPEEQWERMSSQERQAAMAHWQAVEEAREERRAREAELAAEQQRQDQLRIARIRDGDGLPGDLLRVSIERGQMRVGGSHRDIEPLSFTIASGEIRELPVQARRGNRVYRATLRVGYEDGTLMLDMPGFGDRGAARLVYGAGWNRGTRERVSSDGPLRLRDVSVYVEAVPMPRRRR